MAATRAMGARRAAGDRLARGAERLLRIAGDARLGLGLLLLIGLANAMAALRSDAELLDAWPYALLIALAALSGVAAVAVRSPAAWREWRRPAAVTPGAGGATVLVPPLAPDEVAERLASAGYRVRLEERARGGWAVHGVRHGASRFAGLVSHLAMVVIVLGAAIGAAFGSETTFSLLPGQQALLDEPHDGFTSSVRLDAFDAEFGTDARPRRLDTQVTFLEDGEPVRSEQIQVNRPGDFGGYLVHAWTYGPAVELRVTTLGGETLLDGAVPLDAERDVVPVGTAELPTRGATLGVSLTDADANEIGIGLVSGVGATDAVRLRPGDRARIGDVEVEHAGFDAWVTFLSRRDPGLPILLAGALALCASLAVAFWLPRRRLTVRPVPARGELELVVRGERFDRHVDEASRVARALGAREGAAA